MKFLNLSRVNFLATLCLIICVVSVTSSNGLEMRVAYQPFIVTQYNSKDTRTFVSGTQVSSVLSGDKQDLLFQLVVLNLTYPVVHFNGINFSIGAGMAASPLPIRKKWIVSPTDANYTGEVALPSFNAGDFWTGHNTNGFRTGDSENFLIEETNLIDVPVEMRLHGIVYSRGRLGLEAETILGMHFMQVHVYRKNRDAAYDASMDHFSKTAGVNFLTRYALAENLNLVAEAGVNGVENFSSFETMDYDGLSDGYVFNSLRYNAKLGISWKL